MLAQRVIVHQKLQVKNYSFFMGKFPRSLAKIILNQQGNSEPPVIILQLCTHKLSVVSF